MLISDDLKNAEYELKVEAICTEGKMKGQQVEVTQKYPVEQVFDNKGYFHIRKASDQIIDDMVERLNKAVNKSV